MSGRLTCVANTPIVKPHEPTASITAIGTFGLLAI
jgi:hypothetical protein